jgi:hypothetical protein
MIVYPTICIFDQFQCNLVISSLRMIVVSSFEFRGSLPKEGRTFVMGMKEIRRTRVP